jgi:mannose-6-phosphate isomerase-like protein (cupin superfamily)
MIARKEHSIPSMERHIKVSFKRTGMNYFEKGERAMDGIDVDSKDNYKKPFNFEEAQKKGFTRKTLFETEHMRFSIYMILPGQENPLHRHPLSDEILAFTHGSGECVVGDEVVSVEPGSVLFIPLDVPHAVKNTNKLETLACTVVQSPLPCEHVMCG